MGQRESLRKKLAELEERLGPTALAQILDEFEKIVEKMGARKEDIPPKPAADIPVTKSVPETSESRIPDPSLRDPFADLLANLNLPPVEPIVAKPSVPPKPPPEAKKEEPVPAARESKSGARDLPEPEKRAVVSARPSPGTPPVSAPPVAKVEESLPGKGEKAAGETTRKTPGPGTSVEPKPAPVVLPPDLLRKSKPPIEKPPEAPPPRAEKKKADLSAFLPKTIPLRSTYPLEPEDVVYLHAVAQIPLEEKAAAEPFILEEKGIESKEFVFALDRGGLRFFLSRLTGKTTNVSKTGMLLLNRKESIHLRGLHYSILNDLRVYGLLLPFEFGTVALRTEDLYARIDEHVYEVRDALEEIVGTRWWEVCVYGLDQKMMQFVAPDAPTSVRGERDRGEGDRSRSSGSRIDIKTLERVLNKQKSLAEEIHHQLAGLSARSDVDMMVSLSSGSSDDWKPILRASYDVGSPAIYRFNHTINDLQYHHLKYQLMFVLTGDREDFSFQQG